MGGGKKGKKGERDGQREGGREEGRKKVLFYYYVLVFCLLVCLCTMCILGALGDQERALDLELQAVVTCHSVLESSLWSSSQCS